MIVFRASGLKVDVEMRNQENPPLSSLLSLLAVGSPRVTKSRSFRGPVNYALRLRLRSSELWFFFIAPGPGPRLFERERLERERLLERRSSVSVQN